MTTPSEIAREAREVLAEIPLTYVQLHAAVSAPSKRGGTDVKVSGGTRDFVPINVAADVAKIDLIHVVRQTHREIAVEFGEPVQFSIGIQSACEDLSKWSDVWSWHPTATRWLDELHTALRWSQRITGDTAWTAKRGAVCPACLATGCLEVNTETDEHRCTRAGSHWSTLDEYIRAVAEAASRIVGVDPSGFRAAS